MIASCNGRQVKKLIKRINKAMGLPKNSEVLWDILSIANNTKDIKDLKEKVDQLEDCCSCTKSKTTYVF